MELTEPANWIRYRNLSRTCCLAVYANHRLSSGTTSSSSDFADQRSGSRSFGFTDRKSSGFPIHCQSSRVMRHSLLHGTFSRWWQIYPVGTELSWSLFRISCELCKASVLRQIHFSTTILADIDALFRILDKRDDYQLGVAFRLIVRLVWYLLFWFAAAFIKALVIPTRLFLWFAFYRYPLYSLLFPRVREWVLTKNSKLYTHTTISAGTIRVLRIQQGQKGKPIRCSLRATTLDEIEFEALSYLWGTSLVPRKIYVNNQPFYVNPGLHEALEALRYADQDRYLWVDAICINQADSVEKSSQVKMMQGIYAKATQVVVWLGKGEKNSGFAFEKARDFGEVAAAGKDAWWQSTVSTKRWSQTCRIFRDILEHGWWTRVWIIQEIVVARNAVVQIGSHSLAWDDLCHFLTYRPFTELFQGFDTINFVKEIQKLRSKIHPESETPSNLLSLAYRFRHQAATLGHDKLYALLGLARPQTRVYLDPDYQMSREEVFLQFTIWHLQYDRDLTALGLVADTPLQGTSWCRDWNVVREDEHQTHVFSLHLPLRLDNHYALAMQEWDLKFDSCTRTLSLKGVTIDRVAYCGSWYDRESTNHAIFVRSWEQIARAAVGWHCAARSSFERTVVADCYVVEQIEHSNRYRVDDLMSDPQCHALMSRVCHKRRFFVTEQGRFGLGPWTVKRDDIVCSLVGARTPLILRPHSPLEMNQIEAQLHRLVGEAYMDGLVHQDEGSFVEVRNESLTAQWYHLC